MKCVGKKLSIAFYWHMHQPLYQLNSDSDYLMPWARLHGVKDYLDMLLILDDFKKLKLNFNLLPVLLDTLINYGESGYHDIHSRLTVTDVSELTADDKEFILNNFFDANYSTMILHHKRYDELYQKRFANKKSHINDFSEQEYSDIMAWFNLAWVDPRYKEIFPDLLKFAKKGKNFTLEDRITIIECHRKIIRMIIPKYKEFLEKGRIEITTGPYYHPVLPILLDIKSAQKNLLFVDDSLSDLNMAEDAKIQVKSALERIEELFGKRPKGIWPSELGLNKEELELFKELGVEWTISDEGILTNSIKFEFIRDFRGYLEDPYFLTKIYKYKTQNSSIKILFRDSVIQNLINFEYANHDAKVAATDLYDRIKVIQNKLQSSPDDNHLLTIALDGEGCWGNYIEDGSLFLKHIYSMIEEDDSLETVLISNYLEKEKQVKELKTIYAGTWDNRSFQSWVGEPMKNLAWKYLKQVKEDLDNFIKLNPNNKNIQSAHKELMIAQGSDWFWWYGEPNNSGQDHIFDFLFREHLKNVYKYLEIKSPDYLDSPLVAVFNAPVKYPQKTISPKISGKEDTDKEEWKKAGFVNLPDKSILDGNKLFDRVYYGADKNNLYLRLYLNKVLPEKSSVRPVFHQMYIYLRNCDKKQLQSKMRLINKTENIAPIMREKFHNELTISMMDDQLYPIRLTRASQGGLWTIHKMKNIKALYKEVIDVSIPFENLDIGRGEKLEIFFTNADYGVKDSFSSQDILLSVQRP